MGAVAVSVADGELAARFCLASVDAHAVDAALAVVALAVGAAHDAHAGAAARRPPALRVAHASPARVHCASFLSAARRTLS